jgi:hypothetical protein
MSVRECRLVTQWCEFLSHDWWGVNKWYLGVCYTLVSPLVFLVCLVAPYCLCDLFFVLGCAWFSSYYALLWCPCKIRALRMVIWWTNLMLCSVHCHLITRHCVLVTVSPCSSFSCVVYRVLWILSKQELDTVYHNLTEIYLCTVWFTVCYTSAGDCTVITKSSFMCMCHSGVYAWVEYLARAGHLHVVVFISLGPA